MATSSQTTLTTASVELLILDSDAVRASRERKKHLFDAEELAAAKVTGGSLTTFCGIVEHISKGNPKSVQGRKHVKLDDCETCVAVWHREPAAGL